MTLRTTFLLTLTLTLALTTAANLYPPASPIHSIQPGTLSSLLKSHHPTLLQFYAPWCGHCQALVPTYERAARHLSGLAHVAAVNCDDESLKPLCAEYGVTGFPTLKVVRPARSTAKRDANANAKGKGKATVSEYRGARDVKSLVSAVLDAQPNHVKRLTVKNGNEEVEKWLDQDLEIDKILLFSAKSAPAPLLKALAIEYASKLSFGFIHHKQKRQSDAAGAGAGLGEVGEVAAQFGVQRLPSLVFVSRHDEAESAHDVHVHEDGSGGGESHSSHSKSGQRVSVYAGEMTREAIASWIRTEAGVDPVHGLEEKENPKKAKKANKAKKSAVKSTSTVNVKPTVAAATAKNQAKSKAKKQPAKNPVVQSDNSSPSATETATPPSPTPESEPVNPNPAEPVLEVEEAETEQPPAPEPVDEGIDTDELHGGDYEDTDGNENGNLRDEL